MVKITGRYKELIIGEGGENIAPVPFEDHVKKTCDGIAEIMMVGDKRKYNVALVTLKAVGANGEVPGTDDLDAGAKRVNPKVTTSAAPWMTRFGSTLSLQLSQRRTRTRRAASTTLSQSRSSQSCLLTFRRRATS